MDYTQPQSHAENEAGYPLQNVSNFERGLSIGIGALLVYSAVSRFRKTPIRSIFRAALGTGFIVRGAAGICPVYRAMEIDGTKSESVNIRTTLKVNKPRMEVYSAWRNLGSLPRFMKHLKNVTEINGTRSHWEAKIPETSPVSISWDAEIVKDEPGVLLSWQSLPGSAVYNAGKIEFHDALGDQGTEIRATVIYRPPAGNIGTGIAKLFNPLFRKIVKEDIMGFKEYIELRNASMAANGFR
jgi:uncharacterized membrane protein